LARGPEGMAAGRWPKKLKVSPANAVVPFQDAQPRAGLLDSRQDGRFVYYAANFTVDERDRGVPDGKLLWRRCPPPASQDKIAGCQ